jgi:hypothetical protein
MDDLIAHLLPAIEEQLNSPDTDYVREAYDRLLKEPDIDDPEARNMLAFCLADEIERMSAKDAPFDEQRYRMLLSMLPAMPER